MIDSIRLQNYKAFDNVMIPIRPLTILLGKNSSGKSSITQMLMLLHQTAEEKGYTYSSALKIYGNYVNMGAPENLFKERKTTKPLSIEITIKSKILTEKISEICNFYIDELKGFYSYFFGIRDKEYRDYNLTNIRDFTSLIDKLFTRIKKENEKSVLVIYVKDRLHRLGVTTEEIEKKQHKNLYKIHRFLSKLTKAITDESVKISYEICFKKKELVITRLTISSTRGTKLIEITNQSDDNITINSNIVNINKREQHIFKPFFKKNNTIFDCIPETNLFDDETTESPLIDLILVILGSILKELSNELSYNRVNYVSPLRANPKRYYMLDKAKTTISLDTLDGDAIAEVIKYNKKVKGKVNDWLANFGLQIDVEGVQEVIHHLTVKQNGLILDITDVGFGISQILPIILQGFLSTDNSVTIIEQPEIHIHPMMQADLGDLFIDTVKDNGKKLIIETHSEYLLKRIRRRISEGMIPSSDVSICLFHPKTPDNDAWVEILNIEEKGNFEWPEDYYGGELYNDTIEFLKNQL